jgi:hypothetical protein
VCGVVFVCVCVCSRNWNHLACNMAHYLVIKESRKEGSVRSRSW